MPNVINPISPSVFTAIANEMQNLQGTMIPNTNKYTTLIIVGAAIFAIIYFVKKVK